MIIEIDKKIGMLDMIYKKDEILKYNTIKINKSKGDYRSFIVFLKNNCSVEVKSFKNDKIETLTIDYWSGGQFIDRIILDYNKTSNNFNTISYKKGNRMYYNNKYFKKLVAYIQKVINTYFYLIENN